MTSPKRGSVQLAALPWRNAASPEILLITSRETRRWVIPKGWPMVGLSAPEAAAREAFEEAGVEGDIDATAIGCFGYWKELREGRLKAVDVDVFPLRVAKELDEWPERGERTRRWFPKDEAAEAVDELELWSLIRGFSPR